jgi:preprotein translocase subunit SecD
MMYFSRLKTLLITLTCLVGVLLCVPNLVPRPASWLPWRTVHLGLDLQGGSYLLLEVDMKAVVKDRLESMVDAARVAMRPGGIFYSQMAAVPDRNQVVIRLRDPAKLAGRADHVDAEPVRPQPAGRAGGGSVDRDRAAADRRDRRAGPADHPPG